MSFINHATKEIHFKIVYYGAGMSGKTTNIQHIFAATREDQRGKLHTIDTENERTLFFDFLPLTVGDINGLRARFHLYSVPGQTFYDMSQDFILKGVDGIVFVVDSQEERMESNLQSFESLETRLEKLGYDVAKIPIVIQLNKRDATNAVSVEELQATFNAAKRPCFEAIANRGDGVMETLQGVSQMIIREQKGGGL